MYYDKKESKAEHGRKDLTGMAKRGLSAKSEKMREAPALVAAAESAELGRTVSYYSMTAD